MSRTSQHVSIPGRHLVLADIEWFPRLVHNGPITVHDTVGWHCGMIRGALEFEVGCELAVHCAGKADTASCQSIDPQPLVRGASYWSDPGRCESEELHLVPTIEERQDF